MRGMHIYLPQTLVFRPLKVQGTERVQTATDPDRHRGKTWMTARHVFWLMLTLCACADPEKLVAPRRDRLRMTRPRILLS
jgi:hypothetical protein